jgi:hypothetical protein
MFKGIGLPRTFNVIWSSEMFWNFFQDDLHGVLQEVQFHSTNDQWSMIIQKLTRLPLTNSVAPEPEGSSPHSQQPANDPSPEPAESTPHPPNQSP